MKTLTQNQRFELFTSIFLITTIVLLILKAAGIINISFKWVVAPIVIWFVFVAFAIVFALAILATIKYK